MKEIGKIIRKLERWNEWVEIKGTVSREGLLFQDLNQILSFCITMDAE
jgi:hypothetical protein